MQGTMGRATGRRLARERMARLTSFRQAFLDEWDANGGAQHADGGW